MMQVSRRKFIKAGAAGLTVAAMPILTQGAPKRKIKVGVQLYSVRDLCGKDLAGTLKAIKEMGYAGVEFAGYCGKNAKELKQLLADTGLAACGTHTGLDSIMPGKLQATIAFNQEIGNKFLMVPGMKLDTKQDCLDRAKELSAAAVTAKGAGLYVGYHNHQGEFKDKIDGVCKFEILFSNASPDVCMQLDTGHVVSAGDDPIKWFKKFPNRSRTIHAKETYPGPGVLGQPAEGKPGVQWDDVFAAAEADVTEWYIVESEADAGTLEKIRGCIAFLKTKGRA
ncbi:MAG: sugar phosphate isomerase/epimerase [bacterium]